MATSPNLILAKFSCCTVYTCTCHTIDNMWVTLTTIYMCHAYSRLWVSVCEYVVSSRVMWSLHNRGELPFITMAWKTPGYWHVCTFHYQNSMWAFVIMYPVAFTFQIAVWKLEKPFSCKLYAQGVNLQQGCEHWYTAESKPATMVN